jgi:hypothetical protein
MESWRNPLSILSEQEYLNVACNCTASNLKGIKTLALAKTN